MRTQGGEWYSPHRDLANIWPTIVGQALEHLEPDRRAPWIEDLLKGANITDSEISAAASALGTYFSLINEETTVDARDALEKGGWFELRPEVHAALYVKIGQIFVVGIFEYIRDVSEMNVPPLKLPGLMKSIANLQATISPQGADHGCSPVVPANT